MNDATHRPSASRNSVLAAVCLAALTLPLNFSAGAVATPAIGQDLGGSPESLTWITNAFMLAFGSLLMAAGALADRYGRRRVFLVGLALFVGFSFALGLAPSVWIIDLLRAGQGMGAAAALAGGTAALAQEFDGHARTRAFGLLGTTFGVGLASGPLLTGLMIETVGWRVIFLAGGLIGLIALILGPPRMRETKDPGAAKLDWPGAASFTLTLTLFTVTMIKLPVLGPVGMVAFGLGFAMSLAAFVVIEMRTARPMLDLSLFRYPRFVGVQLLPIATCACFVVLLVIIPLRLIGIEQHGAIGAGFIMLGLSAPMLVVPIIATMLARHVSPGLICGTGLLIAAAGLVWLAGFTAQDGGMIALPMLVIGIGAGLPWGLMDGLSISVVPVERAGMATGIFSTVRVAGEGIALSIVSAALSTLISASLSGLVPLSAALLNDAGQRLTVGDLAGAAAISSRIGDGVLQDAYQAAFSTLCWWLAAVTALCAIAIPVLLPGGATAKVAEAEPRTAAQT
ncbi:MFS transporter [Agrobacterium genomosp. 13]|uniref:Major facilitator transporter n=1 Tax=Agrobacterium genomosp. 13 str. CFBP 6927 TaxID=1183428 RepID=A0ABM9VJJ0_9HYPH|nr:MFS transporter [Agrobacterium genomosp. 13]CUX50397.1 Major facilitator transporter [Agrobacterium genomosp. 13 str. CFBP 6927]